MGSITRTVCKGVKSWTNNNIMTFWKTNFNMPVPSIFGTFDEGSKSFIQTFYDSATSFDLSGFYPGWEICVFYSHAEWSGSMTGGSGTYNLKLLRPNGTTIANYNYSISVPSLVSGEWYIYEAAFNIGVASWEVNVSGVYQFKSSVTSSNPAVAIAEGTTNVTFSNVPSTATTGTPGYIWCNYLFPNWGLGMINANNFKHHMIGNDAGQVLLAEGSFWIDTSDYLNWVVDGRKYIAKWRIKQFATTWSNGPSGEVYAPGSVGAIWLDSEYGWTHISYIGQDGYKYITGSGNYPYQAPY
jgi:hypothetical protein